MAVTGHTLLVIALAASMTLACKRGGGEAEGDAKRGSTRERPSARRSPAQQARSAEEAAELIRDDGTIFAEAEMMGTRVSINVWVGKGGNALGASEAITDAMYEIARIEQIASEWRADSDLSRLNQGAGGPPVKVAPELIEILARARRVSAATEGLFDVTFHGVGELWSFEPGSEPPSSQQIAERLPLVDWREIKLDPEANTARLSAPGMKVGLGAIAKGYAVDRAAALLHERGFANHIVEAGGDTRVSGKKGDKPWRVGVQDPEQTVGRIGHLLAENQAVVTSGNYARFFVWEGVHYTHILDPRTGWPIPSETSPKSVTLVASDATDADAYCTAISVMKPEEGLAFVEARPELEAVIIAPDGRVLVSSGLGDRFVRE